MRNPVFGVSDQVRHKPDCTATEVGYRLEISDLESSEIVLSTCTLYVAKTQVLISFMSDLHLCFRICKRLVFS